jgi:hypothetical protein
MDHIDKRQRWAVERLARGDLSEERAAALRRELGEERLRELLDHVQREDEEILRAHPVARVSAHIRSRASAQKPAQPRWAWLAAPLAAGLLALVAVPMLQTPTEGEPVEELDIVRSKGAPARLLVFRQTPSGAEKLSPNAVTRAGDRLQLHYVTGTRGYGVIVSLDGRGVVTPHLPLADKGAAPLAAGEESLLQSYELDDAPGFERFFFVTSSAPFSRAMVEDAARALSQSADPARDSLSLPAGMVQSSFVVQKRPRGAVEVRP